MVLAVLVLSAVTAAAQNLTPGERKLRARLAAYASHAATVDPSARAKRGADGLLAKFEHQVDPEGKLDPADRRRRAVQLRRAHMARLALKSARARRTRGGGDDAAA